GADPMIESVGNFIAGEPIAWRLNAVSGHGVFNEIKAAAKQQADRAGRVEIVLCIVLNVRANAALTQRLGENLGHLSALNRGGGIIIQHERRAGLHAFDRDSNARRGWIAIQIAPANLLEKRNARAWIEFIRSNTGIVERMIRRDKRSGHRGLTEQNCIHHLLTVEAKRNGLTRARVGEEVWPVVGGITAIVVCGRRDAKPKPLN